ncbi:MAG TPA: lipid-binding SYLF domain-containing protein [Vicinamibacterales bacterium]|nr:lipid-binding SYLF domain-containing protein [Vicinamibacterales bacterium]
MISHVTKVIVMVGFAAASLGAGSPDHREQMRQEAASQSAKAAKAFNAIMAVPDKAIPQDLIANAKAIAVFPDVVKVAFAFGGEGGRGVVSRRVGDGWGAPVFLRAGGGSFGPQIGVSSTDLFVLLMTDESVDSLLKDRVGLGGEAGVAAGPVGRNAGAATDARLHAAILSYSRSRGLFAGLALKGVVVTAEDDLNLAVYNKTAEELLTASPDGQGTIESDLDAFPRALVRYTR